MAITKILQSTSPVELNAQIAEAMAQGLRPLGNVSVVDKGQGGVVGFYQTMTDTFPQDGASAYQVWLDAGNTGTVEEYFSAIAGQRMKSEVLWTGVSVVIPENIPTNLIALLKVNTPVKGNMAPFFNTTTNKITPFNQPSTMTFKLNMTGIWPGGVAANRSMTLDFTNSTGNTLSENRITGSTQNTMSFPTFFSIDVDGQMSTNGSAPMISTIGGTFTAETILLIAEQRVLNVI